MLSEAIQHYAAAPLRFEALCRRISDARVGHLAAGVDREGRDFLTVYGGGTLLDGARLRGAVAAT